MKKNKLEKLVTLDEQKDVSKFSFPISISLQSIEIAKTIENDGKYHISCLIIPILRADNNKILIVEKSAEGKLSILSGNNNICFDVIGGYASADKIPQKEVKAGELSINTAYIQAFHVLTEELKMRNNNIPPFIPEDLVFLDFYTSYENEKNNELSFVFGIYLGYSLDNYEAKNINADGLKSLFYEELMQMWREGGTSRSFKIADRLGRLLRRGNLHEVLQKTDLPVRLTEKVDIIGNKTDIPSNIRSVCGVLKPFDINYSISDLLRGYTKKEEKYTCIECEFSSRNENEAAEHWGICHNSLKLNFLRLINIGILDFNYAEKRAFYHFAFAKNASYKEIAEEIGVNSPVTVSSMRQRFDNLVEKSKIILLINEFLNPTKKYVKSYYQELMPSLSDNLTINGFYNKERLHSSSDPLAHATVINLVCKRNTDGAWRFLLADKINSIFFTDILKRKRLLDFAGGGHVEISDLTCDLMLLADIKKGKTVEVINRYKGTTLSNDVFKRCAKREFFEEVKVRGAKVNPRFIELYDIPYDGLTPFGGWNKEVISKIYLLILPQSLKEQNIRVWESWEDSIGRLTKREYVSQFLSWNELDSLYDEGDNFMDGTSRVIAALREKPELKAKMFSLLDQEKEFYK